MAPTTRDWQRTTFGPFARRTIAALAEAMFTHPDDPPDAGARARFEWLAGDADAYVSNASALMRIGFWCMLLVLELLPLFVVGRLSRCSSLRLEVRVRYLEKLDRGRVVFLALFVTVWKTLLTILYFEHPEAAPMLGYDGKHERYKNVKRPTALEARAPSGAQGSQSASRSALGSRAELDPRNDLPARGSKVSLQ